MIFFFNFLLEKGTLAHTILQINENYYNNPAVQVLTHARYSTKVVSI